MPWWLSYLTANWALILTVVAVIVGLCLLAFFLKNWKAVLVALAVAAVAFAFQWVDRNAYQRRVTEETAAELQRLKDNVKISNDIADHHIKRAEEDAAKIDALEQLAAQTPANTGACLDIDAARRLRDIK